MPAAPGRRSAPPSQPVAAAADWPHRRIMYRGLGIRQLRLLARIKVAQVAAMLLGTVPCAYLYATGDLGGPVMVRAWMATGATTLLLLALGQGTRRYVGELAWRPSRGTLVFGTLDFWGNRHNREVPIDAVEPPLAHLSDPMAAAICRRALIPLRIAPSAVPGSAADSVRAAGGPLAIAAPTLMPPPARATAADGILGQLPIRPTSRSRRLSRHSARRRRARGVDG